MTKVVELFGGALLYLLMRIGVLEAKIDIGTFLESVDLEVYLLNSE